MNKKRNSRNISDWIFIFVFLAIGIATMFDYAALKNPTTQSTAIFIAEMLIMTVFILLTLLDSIQRELYDIRNSLDDLYDLKQISALRSTVNRRHLEKLSNDIKQILEEKTDEESKD